VQGALRVCGTVTTVEQHYLWKFRKKIAFALPAAVIFIVAETANTTMKI